MAVTFSAFAGFALVNGAKWIYVLPAMLGTFLLAGGSAALNEIQEIRRDAEMSRTKRRPLVSGDLSYKNAIVIVSAMLFVGTILLLIVNPITAILGWANIVCYNLLYTPLKPKTTFAVLPGALVGAIPPMMGFTAAGGEVFHPNILYMAGFIFLWQVPHFWLLIIKYGKEYEKAGFATLSSSLDNKQIKHLVFLWMLTTTVYLFLFPVFDFPVSLPLMVSVIILNFGFIVAFYRMLFGKKENLRSAFLLINFFMMAMLLVLVLAV